MKKIWKLLAVTAATAATLIPKVTTDEETGEQDMQALLWHGKRKRNEDGKSDFVINSNIGNAAFTSNDFERMADKARAKRENVANGAKQTFADAKKVAEKKIKELRKETESFVEDAKEFAEDVRENVSEKLDDLHDKAKDTCDELDLDKIKSELDELQEKLKNSDAADTCKSVIEDVKEEIKEKIDEISKD